MEIAPFGPVSRTLYKAGSAASHLRVVRLRYRSTRLVSLTMFVSQSSTMALFAAFALSMVSLVTPAPLAQVNMNGNGVMRMNVGKRDVVAPPITSPTTGTVWTVGQTVTVTW